MELVQNVRGTGNRTCYCGSWLQHWVNFSRQSLPQKCCALGCDEAPVVGGHVMKTNSLDTKQYIVPICSTHNAVTQPYYVVCSLVSANVSETCGRR